MGRVGRLPVHLRVGPDVVVEDCRVGWFASLLLLLTIQIDGLYFGAAELLKLPGVGSSLILIPLKAGLSLAVVAAHAIAAVRQGTRSARSWAPAVLYAIVLLSAWANDDGSVGSRRYLIFVAGLAGPAALVGCVARPQELQRVSRSTIVVGYLLILMFFRAFLGGAGQNLGYLNDVGGSSHLLVGQSMAVVFMLAMYAMITSGKHRFWNAGLLIGSLLLILVSGSRGALVGVVVTSPLIMLFSHRHAFDNLRTGSRRFAIMTTALVVGGSAYAAPVLLAPNSLAMKKLLSLTSSEAAIQDSGRTEIYSSAWEYAKSVPPWGNGVGGFARYMGEYLYPHNLVLEIGGDFGVLGVLALIMILWTLFRRSGRRPGEAGAFLPLAILVLALLQFSGSYAILYLFWIFVGATWNALAPIKTTHLLRTHPAPHRRPSSRSIELR